MKNDINLLYKRKKADVSSKKWLKIFAGVVLIAAIVFAGVALPSQSLEALKVQVASLENSLNASTSSNDTLQEKLDYNGSLNEQLSELISLNDSKSDIQTYIDAVEQSLPAEIYIVDLTLSNETMLISGIAPDDTVIASFCLRLRETQLFDDVFLTNSTTLTDTTSFSLTATLPVSLSSDFYIGSLIPSDQETETTQNDATASQEGGQ